MSLRTLLPAPSRDDEDGSSPGSSDNLTKKPKASQACANCRKGKIKCTGGSPKCQACVSRNRECIYDETPQERMAAIKDRMETLEQLFATLRTSTSDEAEDILSRIRASEDPSDILKPSPGGDITAQSDRSTPKSPFSPEKDSSSHRISETVPGQTISPSPSSMIKLLIPDSTLTREAVASFFNCSGKLFHVFTREQIEECYAAVFDRPLTTTQGIEAEVGSLMAVAAVGAQYLPDMFSKDLETIYYENAKFYFEFVIEKQPLQAIKVCTLLAHYNIMTKHATSLAYIEIGLGMCRKYGLDHKAIRPPSMSYAEATDIRRTWRTLVFFSSWLSSTIGYISGNDTMSAGEVISQMGEERYEDIEDVVQNELTKICLIKADVLRMHLSFKTLSAQIIKSIQVEMRTWYDNLPAELQLENLGSDGTPSEFKRSVFHIHLMHLGVLLLLYRRISMHVLQGYGRGDSGNVIQAPIETPILEQARDAAIAANTSARILSLLREDNAVFKRCWLVIFQTYTACTVLLHVAVQKQAHNLPPSTSVNEKTYAATCLEILAFCGSADPVAAKFHQQLQELFIKIFERGANDSPFQSSSTAYESFTPSDSSALDFDMQDARYLVCIPTQASQELTELSLTLFEILSQPFGDTSRNDAPQGDNRNIEFQDTMLHEYPRVAKRFGWEIDGASVGWNPIKHYAPSSSREQEDRHMSTGSDSMPN